LFDIDRSTLVRWRKQGRLPPFTRVAGVEGLTGQQILDLYAQQQRGTAAMSDDAIAAGGEIADAGMGAQPKAPKALA
jgi:expansin (peptidoglycan-binding protein)